jgi:hypothetical protein
MNIFRKSKRPQEIAGGELPKASSVACLLRALQNSRVFCLLGFLLCGCGFAGKPPVHRVTVTISPASAAVALGQSQQFQATVIGTTSAVVIWTVSTTGNGTTPIGTVSSTGLYTAPATLPNPPSVTITATSQSFPASSASAIVTLTDSLQVSVAPASASVPAGSAQAFTATVSSPGNLPTSVAWSVNGVSSGNSTVGTIVSTGPDSAVYTAPSLVPSPATVTIEATSTADTSKSGTAIVTITCSAANSILPASATLGLGQSQSFTASLCGAPPAQISWDVDGVAGGNTTLGTIVVTGATTAVFTAPQNLPAPSSYPIHATAGGVTALANLTIVSGVTVNISPASATLNFNQRQTFTPVVTNTPNTALSWTVNGIANGSTSLGQVCQQGSSPCQPPTTPSSGNIDYIAPSAAPAPDPVTLTATSAADPTRSASAIITVTAPTGNVSVVISPFYVFLAPSGGSASTEQFFATVSGTPNSNVTWMVQSALVGQGCVAAACGSVSASGLYTAPTGAPSPNAISVIATSVSDPTKSAAATVAITSGPVIEVMLPSSVFSGAVESFPLALQGVNFVAGTGASASTILINGIARGTTCSTSTGCATALNLADVQAAGTLAIQIQNPAPSSALSNPVPFVIVPLDTSVGAIPLTTANPASTEISLLVPEPTTAASSAPINVDSIGALASGNCEVAGSPVTVTRPPSGTTTASLCIHGNGLDPTFTYSFTGAGGAPDGSDVPVAASAITGLFPNLIELDLQISNTTLPGVRTLFITTLNNDRAVATGMLEVK